MTQNALLSCGLLQWQPDAYEEEVMSKKSHAADSPIPAPALYVVLKFLQTGPTANTTEKYSVFRRRLPLSAGDTSRFEET